MHHRRIGILAAIFLFIVGLGISLRLGMSKRGEAAPAPVALSTPHEAKPPLPGTTPGSREVVTAAAPASPGRIEQWRSLLKLDRACDLIRAMPDHNSLLQLLLENAEDEVLTGLFGENGPLNGRPNFSDKEEMFVFFNALLHAHMIEGVEPPASDFRYADKLFRDLEQQNPENAAYYLFHAQALSRAGQPPQEQRELLLKAVNASDYDSFLNDVVFQFNQSCVTSATYLIAAREYYRRFPMPEFPDATFVFQLIGEDRRFLPEKVVELGLMMMNRRPGVAVEASLGYQLVQQYWRKAHPKERFPSDLKGRLPVRDPKREAFYGEALDRLKATPCDRRLLDEYFSKYGNDPIVF